MPVPFEGKIPVLHKRGTENYPQTRGKVLDPMMTRPEQRRLCTIFGASDRPGFNGTTLGVLQALITSNPLKGKDVDAEKRLG